MQPIGITSDGRTAGKNKQDSPLFFQPKLTINQSNDMYKQEADAMADKVIHMTGNESTQQPFLNLPLHLYNENVLIVEKKNSCNEKKATKQQKLFICKMSLLENISKN